MLKFLPIFLKNNQQVLFKDFVSRFSSSIGVYAFSKYKEDETYFKNVIQDTKTNAKENVNSIMKIKVDEPREVKNYDDYEGKKPILREKNRRVYKIQNFDRSIEDERNDDENIEERKRFEKQNNQMKRNNELDMSMKSIYENHVKKFDPKYQNFGGGERKFNEKKYNDKQFNNQRSSNSNYSRDRRDLEYNDQRPRSNYSNNENRNAQEEYVGERRKFSNNNNQPSDLRDENQNRPKNKYSKEKYVRNFKKNEKFEVKVTPYEKKIFERNQRDAEEKRLSEERESMMSDVKPTKQTKENFNQFYEYDSENKTFKDVYVQKPDNGVDPASKSNSLMTKSETVPVKLEELDEYSTEAHIRDMKPALRPFAYTLAYFVNESNVLQKFIEMGVEIQQWDADREICEFVLKLNFERDVAPYLIFLHDLGLNIENTAFIIRKNPFFLRETLEDLEMRIKFYESKNFSRENVATILTKSPKWLTMPIEEMEKNLNWYLKEFQLNEQELRDIMIEQPKLCIIGTKCAFDMKFCFKEVLGYSDDRIKRMIKICPKLFTKEQDKIKNNYYYLPIRINKR